MSLSYPSLSTYPPTTYQEMEEEWPGITSGEYQDGGMDYLSLADTPIRRWEITYQHYLQSERDIFYNFMVSSRYQSHVGSLINFGFTPIGESALTGVRLDKGGFTIKAQPAAGQTLYNITIKLIQRP